MKFHRDHGSSQIYRFRVPRLRRVVGRWHLLLGAQAAPRGGFSTIIGYSVLSPRGPRHIWAF